MKYFSPGFSIFWDKRIRTFEFRGQDPTPFHLAMPHFSIKYRSEFRPAGGFLNYLDSRNTIKPCIRIYTLFTTQDIKGEPTRRKLDSWRWIIPLNTYFGEGRTWTEYYCMQDSYFTE
jgi:hypothetical protein